MAFKLTLGDVIEFPVKGFVRDGAGSVPISFTACAKRIPVELYRDVLRDGADITKRDVLADNLTDWRGQRLVRDDQGEYAAYSVAALDMLLSVVGMDTLISQAYFDALQISDTAAGRAKN